MSIESDIAAVADIKAIPTILEVVCRTTGMGFAAVARVTEDRWVACGVRDEIDFGLKPGGELKVETTICHEIRGSGRPVVIDHVAEDESFRGHHTPAMYGFQSYISVPIVLENGTFFGTLCAIDPRPARLKSPEVINMFRLFAELIAFHLDAHARIAVADGALSAERQTAELREQFIAVLGHDLRNPVAAVSGGARLLRGEVAPDSRSASILDLMQSSLARMSELIDNVLDFTRAKLGGGLTAEPVDQDANVVLNQVIGETRTVWPKRIIDARIDCDRPVRIDGARIAQLLSNLLANALTHGLPEGTVRVAASTRGGQFEMSVANHGDPIAALATGNLFLPFYRTSAQRGQQGLGLGLYIASEIAKAHGGKLDVQSTAEETVFTFRMPIEARG
jgi:signal transduction histidine kinase